MSLGTSKESLRDFRINLEKRKQKVKESTAHTNSTKSSTKHNSASTQNRKRRQKKESDDEIITAKIRTHKHQKIPEVIMSHIPRDIKRTKQAPSYVPTIDFSSGDLESDDEISYHTRGNTHSLLFNLPGTPSKPINTSMSPIRSTRKSYYDSTEITIDAPSDITIDTVASKSPASFSTDTSRSLSVTPSLSVERAEKRRKHKKTDPSNILSLTPSFTIESPTKTHDSLTVQSSLSIERPKKHRKHKKHGLSESHAVHFDMESYIHDSEAASSSSFFSRGYTALFEDEEEDEDAIDVNKLIAEKQRASNIFKLGDYIGVDTKLRNEEKPHTEPERDSDLYSQCNPDMLNVSDTISVDSELLMEPLTNETVFRVRREKPRREERSDVDLDTSELEDILDIPHGLMLGSLARFRPRTFD